ncbi:ABC transporter permease [Kitasatospora sp. NPDC101155]|uniref:ABC transporter permease n=1 Tax=Kitasatospora sp. NPDC101155 TaxID=3364097 RepID=UPI0038146B18
MIWLTWRQHRKQTLFTALALALLTAVMVPTGLRMHAVFDSSGLAACQVGRGSTCERVANQFDNQFGSLGFVAILFMLLPLLVGLFFGAPLIAREVEGGTHRLVWTQGVSRSRWSTVKFALLGVAGVLLSTVYAVGVSWWIGPLAAAGAGRFGYGYFDVQGIVPVGYTLFALALGIFAGTVWSRVLPAMATTLGAFVLVRTLIEVLARPHFMPAETVTYGIQGPAPTTADRVAGNWVQAQGVRNAAGQMVLPDGVVSCQADAPSDCGVPGLGPGSYNWVVYQPADRFWEFQAIETGVFVALAAALLWFAVRRIRRVA